MRRVHRGFAVLLALFAMVLFGALAMTMAFASAAETRSSGAILGSAQTLSDAESAAWTTIFTFDWSTVMSFLPGQSVPVPSIPGVSVRVVRLDSTCFFVESDAGSRPNLAGNPRFIRRVGVTIEVTRDSTGLIRTFKVSNRAWTELFQP